MNVVAEPLSRKTIQKITWELRKMAGCDKILYFPIVHFIEWILANPNNDMAMEFELVDPNKMKDTYGTTNTGKNTMLIRSDVYERAVRGNPRDRFTLCHELGHYLLHQPDLISYARGDVPVYCNPEWQANTFAAELMAPKNMIGGMSIEEIMRQCGMSRQAATIQYNLIHKDVKE